MSADVGRGIAAAIERSGLTHKEVGRRMGVTREAVTGWARSSRTPDAGTFLRLAEVLGMSMDELAGRPKADRVSPAHTEARDADRDTPVDWQAIAQTLANAIRAREDTERYRAETERVRIIEVDAVNARSLEAAIAEARAARAIAKDEDASSAPAPPKDPLPAIMRAAAGFVRAQSNRPPNE